MKKGFVYLVQCWIKRKYNVTMPQTKRNWTLELAWKLAPETLFCLLYLWCGMLHVSSHHDRLVDYMTLQHYSCITHTHTHTHAHTHAHTHTHRGYSMNTASRISLLSKVDRAVVLFTCIWRYLFQILTMVQTILTSLTLFDIPTKQMIKNTSK